MPYFVTLSHTGILDSSGLEFFYMDTPSQQDAGILLLGHAVTWRMIIPPNAPNYEIVGFCPIECTDQVLV